MPVPVPSGSRAPGHASTDLGTRLATWLESLGLEDQLRAAGLPAYDRDADGVTWRAPSTGDLLSADRLAQLDELHEVPPVQRAAVALAERARSSRA